MELREIQLKELELLKKALTIIESHNLNYYMLGGTFLGAIRHKGFIPWDDDVDIVMPRQDYEKFYEYALEELKDPFEVKSFWKDITYQQYIIRIINKNITIERDDAAMHKTDNLWIDIIPFDGMPNNKLLRSLHKFNLLFHRLLLQYSKIETGVNMRKKRTILEKVLIKFGFAFSKLFKLDTKKRLFAIDNILKKYDWNSSEYIINFMAADGFKEVFPKKWFERTLLFDFEDIKLVGSSEYDKILTQMYGDYMTPPVQEQRFSHSMRVTEKKYD